MFSRFRSLFQDNSGVTPIEYALTAALIAVAAITAMGGAGTSLTRTFSIIARTLCPVDANIAHCIWLAQNLAPPG
jgi:pilus assembly protein Flp/PilA